MNARKLVTQRKNGETIAHKRFRSKSSKIARVNFAAAKTRLLDVNRWKNYANWTTFQLTDDAGKLVHVPASEGLLLHIGSGQNDDWVRIEGIEQDNEDTYVGIRLRHTSAPGSDRDVANFQFGDTTNNLTLERKNNLIIAKVIGRNGLPYAEVVSQLSWLGGSSSQWEAFLEGIVNGRETR